MRQGACFYNKRLFYSRVQVSMSCQLNYRNIDLSLNRLDVKKIDTYSWYLFLKLKMAIAIYKTLEKHRFD